jgi:hypothetical protein
MQGVERELATDLWTPCPKCGPDHSVVASPVNSQNSPGGRIANVRTPEMLKQAIDGGAAHVHITEHLDLRSLPLAAPPSDCTGNCGAKTLFWGPPKLQSLSVRFAGAPVCTTLGMSSPSDVVSCR